MLWRISHTSTFHKLHQHFTHFRHISQTAKTFHTFHTQIWNDTLFISLSDNPSMFAVSWVFWMFLIMFRSFWRWTRFPFPCLDRFMITCFLGVFWEAFSSSLFWRYFIDFGCIFWPILGPFSRSKLKTNGGQFCSYFLHVFSLHFWYFLIFLKMADLDKTSVFTVFFHDF